MELVFVLVRPAVAENVGAAARALKTMGFGELRVVGSEVHRAPRAAILAHGAGDVLAAAEQYADLPAALADVDLAVATSAKQRHDKRFNLAPAQLREALANKTGTVGRAALVFGCEEAGLSNAELASCQLLSSIPLAAPYPSLNLGQAVMLYAYELSALRLPESPGADARAWRALHDRVLESAAILQLDSDSAPVRWAAERVGCAGDEDVRLLHLWLNALQRRVGD